VIFRQRGKYGPAPDEAVDPNSIILNEPSRPYKETESYNINIGAKLRKMGRTDLIKVYAGKP
jgi:hypothetical protein